MKVGAPFTVRWTNGVFRSPDEFISADGCFIINLDQYGFVGLVENFFFARKNNDRNRDCENKLISEAFYSEIHFRILSNQYLLLIFSQSARGHNNEAKQNFFKEVI